MPVIKCKMCGGDLNIIDDSAVCECEYCGTKQTIPKVDDEKKLKLFSRAGKLLRNCEFDKAAGVFESIVADFPEEAEAYWGLILCKYGIEYVDDPATGKKVPTCHRSSFESVEDDSNFEQACENADAVARRVYREEARQIETLRKRILEVSGKEEPYDVFISYKELDEDGDRTPDSVIAQDIYRALTKEGWRVFFSRISLEGKLGVEYEPYIFAALNSAKVMIVVGTDYEYFDAVWVKNEWSRFLKLIASGQQKTVIPVYKDMDPYDMPKELRTLAAQNMGKIGAMQDLLHGVEKLLGKTNEKVSNEQPVIVQSGGPNVTALLGRGFLALEDEEWSKAQELFDQVLNMDFQNADAYLGLAMAEEHCQDKDAFRKAFVDMASKSKNNKYLVRARQFADDKLQNWFDCMDMEVKEANEKARLESEAKRQAELKATEAKKQAKLKTIERLRIQREKRKMARVMISAGGWHTIGLKSDGSVVAAGSDGSDQCKIFDWADIVSVAAGGNHTVGLRADGNVVAVGRNKEGQCDVSDWTDIMMIAAGAYHTVGLKSNGTVVAAGLNDSGQCDVFEWTDIETITAGGFHTVGLKEDSTVVAIGRNKEGQCEVSGWTDIVSVATGHEYTVGLKSDGSAIAVGNNNYGQCDVSGWTDIMGVAAGGYHTVGLKSDGSVVAVGNNNYGQCDVSEWTDIVAVAVGANHTIGLKANGNVVSVGLNDQGRCDVYGWKLFDSFETIEAEQKVAFEIAARVRKAAAEKAAEQRKAAEEKCEAERRAKSAKLIKEKNNLQTELSNLRGFFSGKRRREIEERLAEIEAEIMKMK